MNSREEAASLLNKLCLCVPRSLFSNIDETQRGYGFVLACLERAEGEVFAGDLAKRLNVSTARIAALLKKMEKSGLLTRHDSSEDGRRTLVEITPAGAALATEMREKAVSKVQSLIEQVGKEDLEQYIRISNKIREAMDK